MVLSFTNTGWFMIRNTKASFGLVSIAFHWVMAALFLVQFWIGLTFESEPDALSKATLLHRHVSIGFAILGLWVARGIWKLLNARPVLPPSLVRGEARAARMSHAALFWLLGVTPLAGWLVLSASGRAAGFMILGQIAVPALPVSESAISSGIWTTAHAFLAYLLLALSGVHALAALRHQFTLKDGLLKRMILPGSRLIERSGGHDQT